MAYRILQASGLTADAYILCKTVRRGCYFVKIGIPADGEGNISECRERGFAVLESQPDFLENAVFLGSYDGERSLRKVLRRFIWHDRIHTKAMYRVAVKTFGRDAVPDIFRFGI